MSDNVRWNLLRSHTEEYLDAVLGDPNLCPADDAYSQAGTGQRAMYDAARDAVVSTVSVLLQLDLVSLDALATALNEWAPLQRLCAENAHLRAQAPVAPLDIRSLALELGLVPGKETPMV